jgi:hypothetical protein
MSRVLIFLVEGLILNLAINLTSPLLTKSQAVTLGKWCWFALLVHGTYLLLSSDTGKRLAIALRAKFRTRVLFSYICIALSGAALGMLYWGAVNRAYAQLFSPKEAAVKPIAVYEQPAIQVNYSPIQLPLSIPPHSSVLVLELTPHIKTGPVDIKNESAKKMWWPRSLPKKEIGNESSMWSAYECQLSTMNGRTFFDVKLVFNLKFIEVKPTQAGGGPTGMIMTMDTTRTDNPMAFAFVDHNKRTIAGTSGRVIGYHKQEVTIPVLDKFSTTLYLVSKTALFTQFTLPESATVVLDKVYTERRTALIRHIDSVLDRVQMWGLNPSRNKLA